MGLKENILAEIKEAMKSKDQDRLSALRFLQSAIKNREIELRPQEITDEDIIGVIKKQVKQRRDSIDQYQKAGRTDLVEKEQAELKILEGYLPDQMSREQIEAVVSEAISSLNATSMKDMGAVMKDVMARTSGAADNKIVSEVVKSQLQ